MNIQIFGKNKCFDTKKAERYFKERGVKYHSVNVLEKGLSKGELTSVINSVAKSETNSGTNAFTILANEKSSDYHLFRHLTDEGKFDKLLECPSLLKTPIIRNGNKATVGYQPDIWKTWAEDNS